MKTKLFFVACSLFLASMVSAQKIKVLEGNLEVLKNEKTINVEFTYDNLKVGKFKTEDEYVNRRIPHCHSDCAMVVLLGDSGGKPSNTLL